MSLSDLASIGSFVSGLAVVVTLIFLLLQMRQANLNERALMQQMRSARTIDTLLKCSEPLASEALSRAFANDATMNDTEVRSYMSICLASLTNWEDSFLQHRAGTLDTVSFASDVATLKVFASLPSFRALWPTMRDTFSDDYRTYVDGLLRETKPVRAPYRTAALWKENLTKELAAAI